MTQVESLTEVDESKELLEMPSLEHGAIGIRLGRYLDTYVDENGLGLVCNSSDNLQVYRCPTQSPARFIFCESGAVTSPD